MSQQIKHISDWPTDVKAYEAAVVDRMGDKEWLFLRHYVSC